VFSRRTGWRLEANELHRRAVERRAAGDLLDLTVSNPTVCGFAYPQELVAALASPGALTYQPQPFGLAAARQAVAEYYRERGLVMAPERLALTASTSEAYSHLFRLLCDGGDNVLMPAPSYPLFEMLAGLEEVSLRACPMQYEGGWHVDAAALAGAGDERTRAVLLVHPNNPAGNYLQAEEWAAVQQMAARRGWAVVVDEVFFDYAWAPARPVALALDACPALTFLLNGCSKLAALPQMKLAWMSVHGPRAAAEAAWARLEVMLDLFLSVDAPIQHAAAALVEARRVMQPQVRARLAANLAVLDEALGAQPAVERLQAAGGWSVMLRLPRIHSDAGWAEGLVERAGVLVHPGHFYGLEQEACLAFSLLPPPAVFAEGVARLLQQVTSELAG
jgi:aspartate/methionine/tyrosine aminotransferase